MSLEARSALRITVASSGLGHVARGIETWAADLGKALAERGEAVTLCKGAGEAAAEYERIVPCWRREASKTRRLQDWLPRRVSWRLGLGSGYGIEQTTFALGLLRHLRRENVDLLHVQDPQVALVVQRARRLGWVRTKTILAHGTEEPAAFLKKITYLQHLAPWHLDECRAAGVWKPTWTAIPNFIDTDVFRAGASDALRAELNLPAEARVVLCAAAIKRSHKRVDHLLDEFARLRQGRPDLPVWLVVAGGWEMETDELIRQGTERLRDRVRFLVRFPRSRMPELYRLAACFALCSLKEMMPIALLEATASGLPCLVNRHPVMEWMIGPGGAAIDMATPGELASALATILGQPASARRLADEARRHCLEHFSRDRVVDQILEYYRFVHGVPANGRLHKAAVG